MELLPPARVNAALRATTERLATELTAPTLQAPEWSEFEWCAARAAAAIHGVSGLLATTLRWPGPDGWQLFLGQQHEQTLRRHGLIGQLLGRIDERLRRAGISAVMLKGAALCNAGLYRPGERPMADIDLLVQPADFARSTPLLEALGFTECFRFWKNWVFRSPGLPQPGRLGEHSSVGITIELHATIRERLPVRVVDISRFVYARATAPAGLNDYPSTAALMAHLLLHAAGAIVPRQLRLIQLADIARLAARMTENEWMDMLRHCDDARGPWWVLPPLVLTSRYFGPVAPAAVRAAAEACCPATLRRKSSRQMLSDLSLSRVWMDALPGIAWTNTPREGCAYVLARAMPDAERRSEIKLASALQPSLANSAWHRGSQAQRIIRWLTSRPTRALTMDAVRAALKPAVSEGNPPV